MSGNIIDKLSNIDRRIIFILIALSVLIPLLLDFHMPIHPNSNVRRVYDTVEEVAKKADGTILLSYDYGPGAMPELNPMALAVTRHCFKKGIRVIGMTHMPDGVGLAEDVMKKAATQYKRKYGDDWVFLGYKTGYASLVINMGEDFHAAFPTDARNNDTKTMKVTKNINSLRDLDYLISFSSSQHLEMWIVFGQEKYNFKLGGGVTAVLAPDLFPFMQSGQLTGLIGGLAGAADYETLINEPDDAVRGMKPQSISHLLIVLLVIFGNLMFFISKKSKRVQ